MIEPQRHDGRPHRCPAAARQAAIQADGSDQGVAPVGAPGERRRGGGRAARAPMSAVCGPGLAELRPISVGLAKVIPQDLLILRGRLPDAFSSQSAKRSCSSARSDSRGRRRPHRGSGCGGTCRRPLRRARSARGTRAPCVPARAGSRLTFGCRSGAVRATTVSCSNTRPTTDARCATDRSRGQPVETGSQQRLDGGWDLERAGVPEPGPALRVPRWSLDPPPASGPSPSTKRGLPSAVARIRSRSSRAMERPSSIESIRSEAASPVRPSSVMDVVWPGHSPLREPSRSSGRDGQTISKGMSRLTSMMCSMSSRRMALPSGCPR